MLSKKIEQRNGLIFLLSIKVSTASLLFLYF
jgi:hypothetical protein